MTYYFSLHNMNVKNFWSDKTVFGGGVVLIAPDESHMLFKCDFVRKRDMENCSVFKIELEPKELNKYARNEYERLRIKLANMTNSSDSGRVTWTSLHNSDDFDDNVEEPYHYYHFAVDVKGKYKLTGGGHGPVKSIKIVDILKNNGSTVEFSVSDEKMAFKPDGTIYYIYSVKIPDKYVESFYLEKDSFAELLYSLDAVTNYTLCVVVTMYRSINGSKGLKDSMGLEIRKPSLKNFWQPEAKPEWSWDVKPLTMKPVESECNIAIDVADVGVGVLEEIRKMSMFESDKRVKIPEIKEIIFNKPATVVYWKDGTKTTVKCGNDEESFDREKAVAMCFLKKMFKPSLNSHWLDVINDAIQAADDKVAKITADKEEKARVKAENIAKAEEAKRKKAEKKAKELQSEIQKLETKSLEEMNSKVEEKENNEVSEEYTEKIFDQAEKENKKWAKETDNKGKKNKMDKDTFLACIKEDLTIDEIAEMNSWDKRNVARMYYKLTGKRPETKPNTYSELDRLFENGVSVDAAARRTGFSKNIVAMRYAKLQNRNNKE